MHFAIHGKLPNDTWSAKHGRALEKTRKIFQHGHDLAHRHGIALVVAFIPSGFRVYRGVVQCTDSRCSELELNDLPHRLGKAIEEVSVRIRYVDLTPWFIAEAKTGRLVYLPDDLHWSAEGHRVAAEAIAAAIDPLVPKRQR
jgi:lysophospholipase L1-like esterase